MENIETSNQTNQTTKGNVRTATSRGYKECRNCHSFVPARSRKCSNCQHSFRLRGKNSSRSKARTAVTTTAVQSRPPRKSMAKSVENVKRTSAPTRSQRISTSPGRGLKPCPNCNKFVGVRSFECPNCHYGFYGHKANGSAKAAQNKMPPKPPYKARQAALQTAAEVSANQEVGDLLGTEPIIKDTDGNALEILDASAVRQGGSVILTITVRA